MTVTSVCHNEFQIFTTILTKLLQVEFDESEMLNHPIHRAKRFVHGKSDATVNRMMHLAYRKHKFG